MISDGSNDGTVRVEDLERKDVPNNGQSSEVSWCNTVLHHSS